MTSNDTASALHTHSSMEKPKVKTNGVAASGNGSGPSILLTDTDRRAYAAQLAIGLSEMGCTVSAVVTHRHPILKASVLEKAFPYHALHPLDSLLCGIKSAKPDLVITCCDRSVQHLHELHAKLLNEDGPSNTVVAMIERSLGVPASYPAVSRRYDLLRIAQEEGLHVP